MEKVNKTDIKKNYADLDEMFAQSDGLRCFKDKIERFPEPIPLKNFGEFMSNVMIVNVDALWTNYLSDETSEAVIKVMEMSFPNDKDIMNVVNAKNFTEIMKKILIINDIQINTGNSSEDDGDDKKKE